MAFTLTSSAFKDGDMIPREFTCDGEDLAPPLAWSDAPEGTRSFALVMEDPDAARGTFTHWLLYDIPATTTVLWEQACAKALCNSFGQADYGGPCPPLDDGPHRYVFTLHALDVPTLDLLRRDPTGVRVLSPRAHAGHGAADGPLRAQELRMRRHRHSDRRELSCRHSS